MITLAFMGVLSANLKYENIYLQKMVQIMLVMIWLGGFAALLKIMKDRILIKFAKTIIRRQQGSSYVSERRYGYYEIAEENKRSAESYRDDMLRKAKQRNLYIFFQMFTGLIIAGLLYLNQYLFTAIFMVLCQMICLIHMENLRDYIYSA